MNEEKRKEICHKIRERIRALRSKLQEMLVSGFQSASVSMGGASQSYTRLSASEIRAEIARLTRELQRVESGGKWRTLSPDFKICGGHN